MSVFRALLLLILEGVMGVIATSLLLLLLLLLFLSLFTLQERKLDEEERVKEGR